MWQVGLIKIIFLHSNSPSSNTIQSGISKASMGEMVSRLLRRREEALSTSGSSQAGLDRAAHF
jgi:hypothetical protein